MNNNNESDVQNRLDQYGLEIRDANQDKTLVRSDLEPDTSLAAEALQQPSNLGAIESIKTHVFTQRASGAMLRKVQESAIHYRGKSMELTERLSHDLRSQKYLNEAQRIGGRLSNELLNTANSVAEEHIVTTTEAIAQASVLEQQRQAQFSSMLERNELREEDANEASEVSKMLTKLIKQDALDRHMKVSEQQRSQFAHAIESDPTKRKVI